MISDSARLAIEHNAAWTALLNECTELEVVPGFLIDNKPFVFESKHIGLNKLTLYKSWAQLAPVLMLAVSNSLGTRDTIVLLDVGVVASHENATVLNLRKRLIVNGVLNLQQELELCRLLLTSPQLIKHAKSPALWAHRRWLLQQQPKVDVDLDAETKTVCQAAQRHSANYYAWEHARRVGVDTKMLWQFCKQHPSDVSAWTLLAKLCPQRLVEAQQLASQLPLHPAMNTYFRLVAHHHARINRQ